MTAVELPSIKKIAKERLASMNDNAKIAFAEAIGLTKHVPNKQAILETEIGKFVLSIAMEAKVGVELMESLDTIIKICPSVVTTDRPKANKRVKKADPATEFGFVTDNTANEGDDLLGDLIGSAEASSEQENDPFDSLFDGGRIRPIEGLLVSSAVATPIGALAPVDFGTKGEKVAPDIFDGTKSEEAIHTPSIVENMQSLALTEIAPPEEALVPSGVEGEVVDVDHVAGIGEDTDDAKN